MNNQKIVEPSKSSYTFTAASDMHNARFYVKASYKGSQKTSNSITITIADSIPQPPTPPQPPQPPQPPEPPQPPTPPSVDHKLQSLEIEADKTDFVVGEPIYIYAFVTTNGINENDLELIQYT